MGNLNPKTYILAVTFLFKVICISDVWAQNETNIWYFGYGAGIDFNSGSPVGITSGVLNTNEGSASICDANGNLLFYSDGITVWNSSHLVMPNGTGLAGGWSSTQSAIIVQQPLHDSLYFLFSQESCELTPLGEHLKYSIINMKLNSGAGGLVIKNVPLSNNVNERNTVIQHSNDTDMWIICNYDSQFFAYLLTSTGIITTPVISNTGPILTQPVGYMKSDPAGNRIAIAAGNCTMLYDFDKTTGMMSNPIKLDTLTAHIYGVEFSPDGSKLYVSTLYPGELWQYDLVDGSQNAIMHSAVKINSSTFIYGALQTGPDQRIYIAGLDNTYLDCVANPNAKGTMCDFRTNAVYLNYRTSAIGLPNHCQNLLKFPFNYTYGCPFEPVKFYLPDTNDIISVYWNFGDSEPTNNESTQINPTHIFATPGTYSVTLILTYPGSIDTVVRQVTISDLETICFPPNGPGTTIQVYPNPSKGNFKVSYILEEPDATFYIYDAIGRLVHTQPLPDLEGEAELNLIFINQGIYIWNILSPGKKILATGKLDITR